MSYNPITTESFNSVSQKKKNHLTKPNLSFWHSDREETPNGWRWSTAGQARPSMTGSPFSLQLISSRARALTLRETHRSSARLLSSISMPITRRTTSIGARAASGSSSSTNATTFPSPSSPAVSRTYVTSHPISTSLAIMLIVKLSNFSCDLDVYLVVQIKVYTAWTKKLVDT